jgi:hypothetical protein
MRRLLIKNAKALVGIRPRGTPRWHVSVRGRAMAELPTIANAMAGLRIPQERADHLVRSDGTLPGITERVGTAWR